MWLRRKPKHFRVMSRMRRNWIQPAAPRQIQSQPIATGSRCPLSQAQWRSGRQASTSGAIAEALAPVGIIQLACAIAWLMALCNASSSA